ncbi:DUF3300 domain-containing protein [Lysobacter sp. KIS68-7]|uniref:DUF3300 domain-containing protein n=1 Tax=Lysobacter sp. KIS68-7 TaxID=2904252 RepID=UPI001E54B913|nr:DUF3300 domain-containing protein [Lysobacter sp. KIS68-7]UHQ20091.1 DUF3300 domain-containing protein [Lysobacter sp. KIS68-7]
METDRVQAPARRDRRLAAMRMTALAACVLAAMLALQARASPQTAPPTEYTSSSTQASSAQASTTQASATKNEVFSKDEIAQIVAPVALYPDSLLAQVLMASTYPGDIADAAAWSKAHDKVKGDDAVKAVAQEPWDPSVQSLVAFPQALQMLGSDIAWVQKLGDAFLAQPNDVMAMAQELRRKAQDAGNLKSNEYQKVMQEPTTVPGSSEKTIVIESTNPDVIYVPSYNPTTVYGTWGYPYYPPYYYPPSAYWYPGAAFGAGLAWGIGIGISVGIWGDCNWGGGDININSSRYNEFNRNINRGDRQIGDRGNGKWQHDGSRRDGVPYRDQASRDKYGNRQAGGEGRDRFRGEDAGRSQQRDQARSQMERQGFEPARNNQQARDRASTAQRDPRSSQIGGGGVNRGPGGSASPSYRQNGANNMGSRDAARGSGGGGYNGSYSGSRNNAFSGASNSGASRQAASRGRSSGSSMSRGGGGAGRSMSRPSRGGGGGRRR